MADTWRHEETKLLIALCSEEDNFSSSGLSSLPSLSSRLKIIHDDKNHGAAKRLGAILFSTSDCEVTLPISIFLYFRRYTRTET